MTRCRGPYASARSRAFPCRTLSRRRTLHMQARRTPSAHTRPLRRVQPEERREARNARRSRRVCRWDLATRPLPWTRTRPLRHLLQSDLMCAKPAIAKDGGRTTFENGFVWDAGRLANILTVGGRLVPRPTRAPVLPNSRAPEWSTIASPAVKRTVRKDAEYSRSSLAIFGCIAGALARHCDRAVIALGSSEATA